MEAVKALAADAPDTGVAEDAGGTGDAVPEVPVEKRVGDEGPAAGDGVVL
jgi:hypothetical protein